MKIYLALRDSAPKEEPEKLGLEMKTSSVLFSIFLLLVSVNLREAVGESRGHSVRIPEHTCHKLLEMNICEPKKCKDQCAKSPSGTGYCRNTSICFCSYYCRQPPQ